MLPTGHAHLGRPGVIARDELLQLLRLGGGEVVLLANVGSEIEERRRRGALLDQQLVVARADGHLLAESPVERLVRRAGFLAAQERQQVHAVQLPLGLHLYPGGRQGSIEVQVPS